ncbi:MAG: NAD-dependent epimerase/dehydratase family protein [Actinomycetota bacterium]
MRVLVTGAAGFIGQHVCDALRLAGHDVVGLDNLHPAAHRTRHLPEGVLLGDVRDPDVVTSAVRGIDVVVHHAAMVGMGVDLADLPEYVSCNDLGTAVLLAGMARGGITRLVLASSMVVYGEGSYRCPEHGLVAPRNRDLADLRAGSFEPRCPHCGLPLEPGLVDEDAPLQPRSVYAATKLAQEHLALAWAAASASTCVALRYHNVYGPGMPRDTPYAGVAAIFRSSLERGEGVRVFEDGGQRRDFVHVSDIALANVAAVRALASPPTQVSGLRAYNIASGEPHTIGEMASALTGAFEGPLPQITGEFRAGDVRHIVASPARAAAELSFTAQTTFAVGMQEFATAPLR